MNAAQSEKLAGLLLDKKYLSALTVVDTQLHASGFVIYKIVVRVVSKTAIDEDQLEVILVEDEQLQNQCIFF